MKNRMIKVWGIVLTLAILAGLLVASVPVSAANLAWTPNAIPSTTNNFLLDPASPVDGWVYAASADGSTILAIDTTSTTNVLYKSVDGGVTFTTKNVGAGLPASGVTMLAMAADNTTAVASAGTAFTVPPMVEQLVSCSLSLTGTITAVDVIAESTIVIGTSDGEFAVFGVAVDHSAAAGLFELIGKMMPWKAMLLSVSLSPPTMLLIKQLYWCIMTAQAKPTSALPGMISPLAPFMLTSCSKDLMYPQVLLLLSRLISIPAMVASWLVWMTLVSGESASALTLLIP